MPVIDPEEEIQRSLLMRVLFSTAPILITSGLLVLVVLAFGYAEFFKLVALMTAIFVFLGKFAVFGGISMDDPMRPFYVAALIVYMDTCVAFLIAFNLAWLSRCPASAPGSRRCRIPARTSSRSAPGCARRPSSA